MDKKKPIYSEVKGKAVPKPGLIVNYKAPNKKTLSASINSVNEDGTVNLTVFIKEGQKDIRNNIQYEGDTLNPGECWDWQ